MKLHRKKLLQLVMKRDFKSLRMELQTQKRDGARLLLNELPDSLIALSAVQSTP